MGTKQLSNAGEGSTVWSPVTLATSLTAALPANASRELEALRASPIRLTTKPAAVEPKAVRVLLVEDNLINQKVALAQLKRLGYSADDARDGREALVALERVPYDVVLMDCQMPEMDGYEATRELRKREAGSPRHTIVIAMTAFGLQGDRDKCLAAGMDDYLAKPVRMELLEAALNRWLFSKPGEMPAPVVAQVSNDRSAGEVLDSDVIATLRDEGDNLLVELIDLFNVEVPAQLRELDGALRKGDTKTAALIGHKLKGTAGTFGANQMRELAADIDQAARDGLVEQAVGMLDQLRPECDRVLAALEIERVKQPRT